MTEPLASIWWLRKPRRASTVAKREAVMRQRLADMEDNINALLKGQQMTIREVYEALKIPRVYVEPCILHMHALGELVEIANGKKSRLYTAATTVKRIGR